MKKTIIIIVFITVITFITQGLYAQQVSLSITPPLLELFIKPGKSIMVAYKIENHGDPIILTTRLVNFEPKDNFGNVRLKKDLQGPVRFSLDNSDIQLEQPFFLKTGTSQQLLLRIRIPEGAIAGDYYYTFLAESNQINTIKGLSGSTAKASIGSNILITITDSGIVEVKPKIVLFKIVNKYNVFGKKINIFDSFDKVPLVFIIENKGKNLIKPQGKITLTGNFKEKLVFDIIPKNILAESQRQIEVGQPALEQNNEKQATFSSQLVINQRQPVTLTLSGFFIGLYRLSAQVAFGENSPNLFANTQFFAFPFKLTIVFVFLTIISIIVIKKNTSEKD